MISSSAGFQSDMHLIVEQCVAQVREAAGLASFDAEVVLPRTLPRKGPPPLPTRVPPPLPKEIASSKVSLGLEPTIRWEDLAAALPAQTPTPRANVATVVAPRRRQVAPRRWPIWLCAFVAGMSASAAFIASPVGHRPMVRRVVVAAQTQTGNVVASLRSIR